MQNQYQEPISTAKYKKPLTFKQNFNSFTKIFDFDSKNCFVSYFITYINYFGQ